MYTPRPIPVIIPNPNDFLNLTKRQRAGVILEWLNSLQSSAISIRDLGNPHILQGYTPESHRPVLNAISEAWSWLESNGFVSRIPNQEGWYAPTQLGQDIKEAADIEAYRSTEGEMRQREGVFISHISEESGVANRLKQLLREAFGTDLKVFVSSDYDSLHGGDKWFTTIVETIKLSQVVLVLVSKESILRPWIPYEAGVGEGAGIKVIPVIHRDMGFGDLTDPIRSYHVRNLHDVNGVRAMIRDIADQIKREPREIDVNMFSVEVSDIEKNIPARGVMLKASLQLQSNGSLGLSFELMHTGNQDIELIHIWVAVPKALLFPGFNHEIIQVPPALLINEEDIDGKPHLVKKYVNTTEPLERYYYRADFEKLPHPFQPSMSPLALKELHYWLKGNLDDNEKEEFIQYRIFARGLNLPLEKIKIKELLDTENAT